MRPLVLSLAAVLFGAVAARAASPYPVHIEHQRGQTLIIKHTPVPTRIGVRTVYRAKVLQVRKVRRAVAVRKVYPRRIVPAEYTDYREYVFNPALAGGCRDGGYVRGRRPDGQPLVLHKDVCEGIAPISSLPGRY
jgi:hypothetical protein